MHQGACNIFQRGKKRQPNVLSPCENPTIVRLIDTVSISSSNRRAYRVMLRALGACVAALLGARGVCALAEQKIGGQTGDVAGATQVLAELAFLLVLAMG